MDKKGFTLIELLIVVSIIGILSMIAVPLFVGQSTKAARTEASTNLQNLRLLEEQYYAENGCYYKTGGPPTVCTNATIGNTTNPATSATAIQGFLTGFKPGSGTLYAYQIVTNQGCAGNTAACCFIATATGVGTRVAGDSFTIDCNNNRNF